MNALLALSRQIDALTERIGRSAIWIVLIVVLISAGNAIMRYAFNSGFSISEELSRWLFVWLTFLGAVAALRSNAHLGTDMLVGRLGPKGKKFCMGISLVLMLFCLWLLFKGSYDQAVINWDTTSAVVEVSVAYFSASGMVFAVLGGLIVLRNLWLLVTGQLGDEQLVMMQESEEAPHAGNGEAH